MKSTVPMTRHPAVAYPDVRLSLLSYLNVNFLNLDSFNQRPERDAKDGLYRLLHPHDYQSPVL